MIFCILFFLLFIVFLLHKFSFLISLGVFPVSFLISLVEKYFDGNRYQATALSCIYLFLIIQCMPDGNEGLYWHAGVVNYTWAFAFLLMLTGVTLSLIKEENSKKSIVKTILAFVFAVFVGGGNFITALQGCIWMVLIAGLFVYYKIKSEKCGFKNILSSQKKVFVPVITIVAAFGVSVLAPGNQVRIDNTGTGFGSVKAIIMSFAYCLEMPMEEWISFSTLLLLALAVPFMWNVVKNSKIHYVYPGLAAALGFGIASAAFTPNLYAQGSMMAGRLHDTAYFIFITILYMIMFYIIGWIQQTVEIKQVKSKKEMSEKMLFYVVGISVFLAGSSLLDIAVDKDTYVSSSALMSLLSGQAENYRQENEVRLDMLYHSNEEIIEVTGFTNPPELLHFQDVAADENDWVNRAVARYYKKDSIRRVN